MPRSTVLVEPEGNRGRSRTREQDAARKRAERAERARREGRTPRAGSAGRAGKRDLSNVFAVGEFVGETLNPKEGSAGEWTTKGAVGMRHALERAFRGSPLPCRLAEENRRAYACLVVRLPDVARAELAEERRRLARAIVATLAREYPEARYVVASVPRRLEQTRYGVQRRGAHGVAVLFILGRPARSTSYVAELERGIVERCGWDAEGSETVPFSDAWRLLDDHGDPMHRVRRGAGKGARRRADLAWLASSITSLTNPASAFVGTSIGCESIATSSEISNFRGPEDASVGRPHLEPARREIEQKSRRIASFVVAGEAA